MTIVEFLEACLAEDEADPYCGGWGEYYECDLWIMRHVAEAQAKRKIIADMYRFLDQSDEPGRDRESALIAGAVSAGLMVAIRSLSAVYSSHPDFQAEEWS